MSVKCELFWGDTHRITASSDLEVKASSLANFVHAATRLSVRWPMSNVQYTYRNVSSIRSKGRDNNIRMGPPGCPLQTCHRQYETWMILQCLNNLQGCRPKHDSRV